jgi:hypothetical protein
LPAVSSRCLSAAGIRFSAILSRLGFRPSYDRPASTKTLDHDGVTAFRTYEIRPERAPSLSRDRRCSRRPGAIPGPPPAASQRHGPLPRRRCRLSGVAASRDISQGFTSFARPAFPSPVAPRRQGDSSGFPLGSAPTRAGPAHARQGGDRLLSTSPELRRWPTCQPSNPRVHSQHVRPRVARALARRPGGTARRT